MIFPARFATLITLLTSAAFADVQAADPSAPESLDKSVIAFRKSQPQVSSVERTSVRSGNAIDLEEAEDLAEKIQTLEGELRFSKAKHDAAQKKLSVQSAAGNLEQAEKAQTEVKDWEGRVRSIKDQLALAESELEGSSSSPQSGAHPGESDVIVPGENLEVFVVEDASFNGRHQVRRGGYIILPQIGRIPVAGKTIGGAEASVKKALQHSQLQRATVMIERITGSDVESGPLIYLSGEFKRPRPYKIPSGTAPTIISVILSCGGVTDSADLTRVKVMRVAQNRSVVEEINVQKILDGGGLASDLTLTEGDVIIVPGGPTNLIYVTGNVRHQGSYKLAERQRLTAYGAILQSGGFARYANQKRVHVLRAMPDGTKAKLPVNVVDIQKGKQADVILETGDIVVVPEKFWSF